MGHHTKIKGDLGLVKAIADLTQKGYNIFIPLFDHLRYDLVVEKKSILYRIQVKYSASNQATSKTNWADKNGNHKSLYEDNDFDYYALYIPSVDAVIYPSIKFKGCSFADKIPNSATPFYWYKDFLDFTDLAQKRTYKEFGISLTRDIKENIKNRKVVRPSKEELYKLIWEKPTVILAKNFGVSDKAIEKWVKSYGINKPPRGYWANKKHKTETIKNED